MAPLKSLDDDLRRKLQRFSPQQNLAMVRVTEFMIPDSKARESQ